MTEHAPAAPDAVPGERSLDRAVRMMRLLGVMALVPVAIGLPNLVRLVATHGVRTAAWFGTSILFCLVVCACFFTFAAFVRRRRLWAALSALAAAGITVLLFLVAIVRLVGILYRIGEPRILVPIGLAAIVVVALGSLMFHLLAGLPAVRVATTPGHAFEPLMAGAAGSAPQVTVSSTPIAALPDSEDVMKPLHLAIRSTRLLGIVSTLFGFVFVIAFGYFNRYQRYRPHFIAMGLLVWFVPGVLFFTCAGLMKQRRRAGAAGGIAVAGVQELFAVATLVGSLMLPPVSPIPVVLSVLWIAALGQLLYHLRRSLPLLEHDPQRLRGFEVTAPQRVLPLEQPRGE